MKIKKLFVLSALLVSCGILQAQNYVIDDFENGNVSFTDNVNINPEGSGSFEVVNNPAVGNGNTTARCWKYTRLNANDNWAGFWSMLKTPFNTSGYTYLHVKYYRENANSQLRVMFEGNGFKQEFLPMADHAPKSAGEWENLVFDLAASGVADKQVTVLGLQPDFCSPSTVNTVVYIDEIKLSNSITGEDGFSAYQPQDVKTENVTETSLTLTWAALQDAVSYDVYQDDVLVRENISDTSCQIGDLQEFSVYRFHIVAKNEAGTQSLPSHAAYVETAETTAHRDNRMAWWREARFGMFIHWGGYAALAGHYEGSKANGEYIDYYSGGGSNGGYAEWIMFAAQIPRNVYRQKIAEDFTAENYNPAEWVRMAKEAGMKYIIITAKHHEGLAMFNTHTGWNVTDHSSAQKDLLRGLVDAAREENMKIGFYYSQALDWMNDGGMGWMPQNNGGYGGECAYEEQKKYVNELVIPHLNTILNDYAVDVVWFDMGQSKYPDLQYATIKAIKENPNSEKVIFNDRLGFKINNGLSGDFETPEQSIPDVPATGRSDGRDWETCMTMNENWGYCAHDNNWKPTSDLIGKLIDIASKGGNFLLNIGPKADGTFPQESIERLTQIGAWMETNGEAIYGTIANPFPASFAWGKSTRKVDAEGNTTLYLHVSQWPENGELTVAKLASLPKEVSVLGLPDAHPTAQIQKDDLVIKGLPTEAQNEYSTTIKLSFDGEIQINETFIYPNEKNILTLLPDDAKVEGLIVEGDANMRNIGSWAADKTIGAVEGKQAQWNIYVPLTGTYNVSAWLGAQLGGQFNIAIDGTPAADLDYPDGTAYHVAKLGTIELTEGKHVLTLTRTSTTAEWNYVNLLNLVFTPADLDTCIYPDENNVLTLLPDDAKVEGLIVEGDANMRNIGGWAADKTIGAVEGKQAQWNIYVPLTGTYDVSAWLGAQLGGQFNIAIDGTPAADLNYPDGTAYHVAELGTINLTEGKHVLTLTRTSTTAEWNYVNLLNLVFTPQPGIGTGISAPDTLPLQIFAGNGNVRLSGLKAGEIVSIYDVLGHCLLKTSATATTEQYAIARSGVLIVRVETEGRNIQTAKIIL